MAQIHELESKSRFGTRYIVGIILAISTLLVAGWVGFFVFLPIKSGMSTIYELEDRFLPRAEGMVLDFVSLSEPSIIITSDDVILDELHDGLNRDPIKLADVPPFVINTLLAAEDFDHISKALEGKEIKIDGSVSLVPSNTVQVSGAEANQLLKLLDILENHEDVQKVYSNFDIDDDLSNIK